MAEVDKRIEEYINIVCKQVKNRKVHKLIEMELLCHLDEVIEDYMDRGIEREYAIEKAIKQMGAAQIVGEDLNRIHKRKSDFILLAVTAILISFGLLTMAFLQNNILSNQGNFFGKSLITLGIGIVAVILFVKVDFRCVRKYSKYIYCLSVFTLIMTYIISPTINGAMGYIIVGPISFNAINISIILFIISLAGIFTEYSWINKWKVAMGISLVLIPAFLMISLNSIAMMAVYLIASFSIMLLSGLNVKYFIISIGTIATALVLYISQAMYRIERLIGFLNPNSSPQGSGYIYNLINSMKSSAGVLGNRDMRGLELLPQAHTDLVFTAIVYSFGWIAGIAIMAVIAVFIIRIILIGFRTKETYGKLVVGGIGAMFATQFVFSTLANLSMFPMFGASMPFLSYGGTNLIISIVCVAIMNNIYKNRNIPYFLVK